VPVAAVTLRHIHSSRRLHEICAEPGLLVFAFFV